MYLLYQHLEGNVKKAVEQLQYMVSASPEIAYTEARKKLKSRFRRPWIIATDFENKLSHWPKIANNGVQGLREFSDFLYQVEIAMNHLHSLKIFKYPSKLQTLSRKAPRLVSYKMVHKGTNPTTRKRLQCIRDLQDLALDDRRDFFMKKKLWFKCVAYNKHIFDDCDQKPPVCDICCKKNLTELHVEATPGRKGTPNTTNETKTTTI